MSLFQSFYFHFPFCETKCHYCDFYSIAKGRARVGDSALFEESLKREIELWKTRVEFGPVRTVFFGGGTPSMTEPDSMARAVEPFLKGARFEADYEWTMEANPSSIDLERMKAYRVLGVNRVSMGVQAIRDDLLKLLGRVHDHAAIWRALDDVFNAGFDNASTDLLCGVPGQTIEDLDAAIDKLTSYPIRHLSCYILTLPQHHRMFGQLPDENVQLEHYLFIDRKLREKGFEHYEISNFAKPGFQARHNLAYWTGESYLSFGPSAHSFDASSGERWKNFSSLHRYGETLKAGELPVEWTERLSAEQTDLEKWMLATRLDRGFPERWLETERQRSCVKRMLQAGLMEPHPTQPESLRLTVRGFAVSEQVVREIVA